MNKDHKEAKDKIVGPDVRPIMGAVVGPNIGLSEIGSIIVRKIADNADMGLVAKSTEEVLNKIEEFNKRRIENNLGNKKLIIASMDIEKFYNNIISEKSAKIIRKMWEESELVIEGIDTNNLKRYLGIHLKKEELSQEGFEELVYTREKKQKKTKLVKKVGKKLEKKKVRKNSKDSQSDKISVAKDKDTTVDTLDKNNGDEGADTLNTIVEKKTRTETKKKKATVWLRPKRNPTTMEQRRLFGKALEIMLVTCMDNHIYQ